MVYIVMTRCIKGINAIKVKIVKVALCFIMVQVIQINPMEVHFIQIILQGGVGGNYFSLHYRNSSDRDPEIHRGPDIDHPRQRSLHYTLQESMALIYVIKGNMNSRLRETLTPIQIALQAFPSFPPPSPRLFLRNND